MDFFYSIVGFFSTGGIFMYPILLVFAVVDGYQQKPGCLEEGAAFADEW
jgi:hypothetical protein